MSSTPRAFRPAISVMSSSYAAPQLPPNAFDDISGSVVGVMTFCLVWSTLMVGLRIWTRWKIIESMGADDYAIISGLVSTTHRLL